MKSFIEFEIDWHINWSFILLCLKRVSIYLGKALSELITLQTQGRVIFFKFFFLGIYIRKSNPFTPEYPKSHVGDTIGDILEERNISIEELASMISYSPSFIRDLIDGKEDMTEELAIKLEQTLGSTKEFWIKRADPSW